MLRRIVITTSVLAGAVSGAWAGDPRWEIGGTAGWTFSDGVSGTPEGGVLADYTRIDPGDDFSWGARVGFFATPHLEIGALFNAQPTTLELGGPSALEVGNERIDNYHGYVAWNFGAADATARPYLLGGLGATRFGSVSATVGDVERQVGGSTKFSTTWAVGLKAYANENVGIQLEARWTPTYIKSDAAGWWCDPYWGCYTLADAQYANQFELSGGLNLRF